MLIIGGKATQVQDNNKYYLRDEMTKHYNIIRLHKFADETGGKIKPDFLLWFLRHIINTVSVCELSVNCSATICPNTHHFTAVTCFKKAQDQLRGQTETTLS